MSGSINSGARGKPDLRARIYFEHAEVVGADDTVLMNLSVSGPPQMSSKHATHSADRCGPS